MNEKLTGALATQAKQLKRLALYTVIVLVVFAAFISLLGMEIKKEQGREKDHTSPPVAVAETPAPEQVPTDSTLQETASQEEDESKAGLADPLSEETSTQAKTVPPAAQFRIKEIKWPARGKIIRNFGISYSQTFSDYRFHRGVDIELRRGSEVKAVSDGKITSVTTAKGEAGVIIIDHGSGWQSLYAHLNEFYVKPGDKVKQGQILGSVDQPGLNEVLEGPHLHFELSKETQEVNPLDYLPD